MNPFGTNLWNGEATRKACGVAFLCCGAALCVEKAGSACAMIALALCHKKVALIRFLCRLLSTWAQKVGALVLMVLVVVKE